MKTPRLRDGSPGFTRKGSPSFRPKSQSAVARREGPQDSASPRHTSGALRGGSGTAIKGGNQSWKTVSGAGVVERSCRNRKFSCRGQRIARGQGDPTSSALRASIGLPRGSGNAPGLQTRRGKPRSNANRSAKNSLLNIEKKSRKGSKAPI